MVYGMKFFPVITGVPAFLFFTAGLFTCSQSRPAAPPHYDCAAVDTALISVSPVSVPLSLNVSHSSVSRYGILPQVCVCANGDNSFDAGVYVSGSQQIRVVRFDAAGSKIDEVVPGTISGARGLLGMAKIPADGSFVIGWSKDNSFGSAAFEYWISRFDQSGGEIFSTRIFGDQNIDSVWAKGQPGSFSSGRIVFNPVTQKIGFYCGHTMKWDDGVRHQGGYIGFMDLAGSFFGANTWFFSHNFDQRLIAVDSFYYALAHGDAYPRALGFSKWRDAAPAGSKLADVNYFAIPGTVGDNATNTQTGGIIPLADGNFGVVFTSAIDRSSYDVCYMQISPAGAVLATVWITFYQPPAFALFPRIAPYGANVLLMWEEINGSAPQVTTCIVGGGGTVLSPFGHIDGIMLSPWYDLVPLPNGDMVWVTTRGNDSLAVGRIKAPE
jgi:hypothetical protein